jgi:2-polyprenyl-3-methyl-5-hydroxy-6-metoxy-1,4-benzoquinol methylase
VSSVAERIPPLLERLRHSLEYRTGVRLKRRRFPSAAAELAGDGLFRGGWYYSVELLPGLVTRGVYPPDLPMLPRLMLRRCELAGADCLDLGCMEGLIPVLMRRGGAAGVLGVDAIDHCLEKLDAVRHYYGAEFEYRSVGLMYDLAGKLGGRGFDLINCSGLLYHVFSPLAVLCGVRPLLRRGGLLIVSTNVTVEDGYAMEFNDAGRLQAEPNTFWYLSVRLFDYLLRYLRLAPLDCLFVPHAAVGTGEGFVFDKPSGYLSVLCRASDEPLPARGDEWMRKSAATSWEYLWLADWERAARQRTAAARLRGEPDRQFFRPDIECLDLWEAVRGREPLTRAADPSDTHLLRLSDRA